MRKLHYYNAKVLLVSTDKKNAQRVADELWRLFSDTCTTLVPDNIAVEEFDLRLSDDEILFRLQRDTNRGKSFARIMDEFTFLCGGDRNHAARLIVYSMKHHKNKIIAGSILREIADNGPYAALLKKWGKKIVKKGKLND